MKQINFKGIFYLSLSIFLLIFIIYYRYNSNIEYNVKTKVEYEMNKKIDSISNILVEQKKLNDTLENELFKYKKYLSDSLSLTDDVKKDLKINTDTSYWYVRYETFNGITGYLDSFPILGDKFDPHIFREKIFEKKYGNKPDEICINFVMKL